MGNRGASGVEEEWVCQGRDKWVCQGEGWQVGRVEYGKSS